MTNDNYAVTADEMVRRISTIPDELGASACFGTPVERDGHTIIPVARVQFGYGMGFGGGNEAPKNIDGEFRAGDGGGGGGGGGGGSSTPVAIIDITERGVEIEPVTDSTRIALASFTFAAWALFWITATVRTIAREHNKTARARAEKA